jgi:hypothetical protein
MKNQIKKIGVLIAFLSLSLCQLHAQSVYRLTDSKDVDMKLSGTSTLHKWDMNATAFKGHASFGFKAGSTTELTAVTSLTFVLPVANLSSGEKGLDKNAYKALQATKYKNIVYKLTSAIVSPQSGSKYSIKASGSLTIAGVAKPVVINVDCVVGADGILTCTGTYQLNMTDYSVKPPTFMLGAMKTGDAVTLAFTMIYKKTTTTQLAKL